MKMGHSLFWGLLLVVLGLSLILRIVFNIDFPIFKIFLAFVLIYFGIKLLFGSFETKVHVYRGGEKDIIFGEKTFSNIEGNGEYNTVFGKGSYDFRGFDLKGEKKQIKISTVFGGTVIKLDKDLPVRIKVESVFAGADLPNGNSAVFGSTTYESPTFESSKPFLDLKLEAVFGGVEVKTY
jgi:predicted membrane protein